METTLAKTANRSNAKHDIVVVTLTAGNLHTNQNPNLCSNRMTVRCSIKWFTQHYLQANPK